MRDDPFHAPNLVDCWSCGGEGFMQGECTCGEDCCCCLEPDEPECPICEGSGTITVSDEYLENEKV